LSKVKAINEALFDDRLNFIPAQYLGFLDESDLFEEQKSMMILHKLDTGISKPFEKNEIIDQKLSLEPQIDVI
jgi:hypothetical protein